MTHSPTPAESAFAPRLCRDCIYSRPEPKSDWNNICTNGRVVATHPYALANNREGEPAYPHCSRERERRSFLAPCGMRGKRWVAKETAR